MNKKTCNKFDKVEHPRLQKKVKLEVYDDGLYVGTINTDFTTSDENPIANETLIDYVHKVMPTRKKKYLSVKIV
jgi:hypothetical protein